MLRIPAYTLHHEVCVADLFHFIVFVSIFSLTVDNFLRHVIRPVVSISQQGVINNKGGANFLIGILDVCCNQGTKQIGDTNFKCGVGHHWAPAGDGHSRYVCQQGWIQGEGAIEVIAPSKSYESNFSHHDFVQFEK